MNSEGSAGSPRLLARIAGGFYLLNIVTSLMAFSGKGGHFVVTFSGLVATASYIAVTALLYFLFRPVNRGLSLIAACFSLAGCAAGELGARHLLVVHVHPLVFFGCYCLLIGYLIMRSRFLPWLLGVLMAVAGLGWLTFLSARSAAYFSPYHYIAGGVGEGLLTLWLLVMGVNAEGWKLQAETAR
jgi:hypothetical protein